jgi:hypothetical protein
MYNNTTNTIPTTTGSIPYTTQPVINDITQLFPNLSSETIVSFLNSGVDLMKLYSDKNYMKEKGMNFDSEMSNSSTNIYQKNFSGTSNVYSPYLYYDKNSKDNTITTRPSTTIYNTTTTTSPYTTMGNTTTTTSPYTTMGNTTTTPYTTMGNTTTTTSPYTTMGNTTTTIANTTTTRPSTTMTNTTTTSPSTTMIQNLPFTIYTLLYYKYNNIINKDIFIIPLSSIENNLSTLNITKKQFALDWLMYVDPNLFSMTLVDPDNTNDLEFYINSSINIKDMFSFDLSNNEPQTRLAIIKFQKK